MTKLAELIEGDAFIQIEGPKRIKRTALCKAIGISYNALYNYEKGIQQPRLDIAHKLVEFFEGHLDYKDLIINKYRSKGLNL